MVMLAVPLAVVPPEVPVKDSVVDPVMVTLRVPLRDAEVEASPR
jgi:hypothetical protein